MSMLREHLRAELQWIDTLIDKAERSRAYQAEIVARLPRGCTSAQAVLDCEVLQAASLSLYALHQKRMRLLARGKMSNEQSELSLGR